MKTNPLLLRLAADIKRAMTQGVDTKRPKSLPHNTRVRIESGEPVRLESLLQYLDEAGLKMAIEPVNAKTPHDLKAEYIAAIINNQQLRERVAAECGLKPDDVLGAINSYHFRVKFAVLYAVADYYNLKITDVCFAV